MAQGAGIERERATVIRYLTLKGFTRESVEVEEIAKDLKGDWQVFGCGCRVASGKPHRYPPAPGCFGQRGTPRVSIPCDAHRPALAGPTAKPVAPPKLRPRGPEDEPPPPKEKKPKAAKKPRAKAQDKMRAKAAGDKCPVVGCGLPMPHEHGG